MSSMTEDEKQAAFDESSKVAQIFSGVFFAALAVWLLASNTTKLAFVQRAALEKRLTVCCFICTYVALFSAFFNFLQLTEVDNAALPYREGYTMDFCRPIEWICTCPFLQLVLVLMGGSKIPEYRRVLMPLLAEGVLFAGLASTIAPMIALRVGFFVLSCAFFGALIFFNAKQLKEYSNGEESILRGDSEYRKASLILMSTWFPFPIWYALSPEGLNVIKNITIIQVGWAFFNITAKFSLIFYIQRIKDLYCNRLKTKRELMGTGHNKGNGLGAAPRGLAGNMSPPILPMDMPTGEAWAPDVDAMNAASAYYVAENEKHKEKLGAVVMETMNFLGMAQNCDRLIILLEDAGIQNVSQIEAIDQRECELMQLPYDLISALQKRIRVWKLEMQDDAEMGLEKGEVHYMKSKTRGAINPMGMPGMANMGPPPFTMGNMSPRSFEYQQDAIRRNGHMMMYNNNAANQPRQQVDLDTPMELGAVAGSTGSMELSNKVTDMEKRIMAALEAIVKTNDFRAESRGMESRVTQLMSQMQTKLEAKIEQRLDKLDEKVDHHFSKLETRVDQRSDVLQQKLESSQTFMDLQREEAKRNRCAQEEFQAALAEHLEKLEKAALQNAQKVAARVDESAQAILGAFDATSKEIFAQSARLISSGEANCQQVGTILVKMEENIQQTQRVLSNAEAVGQQIGTVLLRVDSHAQQTVHVLANNDAHAKQLAAVLGKVEDGSNQALRLSSETQTATAQRCSDVQGAVGRIVEELQSKMESGIAQKFEDVIRQCSVKRVEDLAIENKKTSERSEAALESFSEQIRNELLSIGSRLTSKADAVHALVTRQQQEIESGIQQAMMALGSRTEKSIESFESNQRGELSASLGRVTQKVESLYSIQTRSQTEVDVTMRKHLEELVGNLGKRDEQAARHVTDQLEALARRSEQAVEDSGNGMKRELHSFAKRLNTKFPFM